MCRLLRRSFLVFCISCRLLLNSVTEAERLPRPGNPRSGFIESGALSLGVFRKERMELCVTSYPVDLDGSRKWAPCGNQQHERDV